MQKYGIIKDDKLVLSDTQIDGYKLVVFEEVPEFDQVTHYVVQGDVVDNGDVITVGYELNILDQQDDVEVDEPQNEESKPFVPKPTADERLEILENTLLLLMME